VRALDIDAMLDWLLSLIGVIDRNGGQEFACSAHTSHP
jgi:hypothetical protein